jgi:hypothetical protein
MSNVLAKKFKRDITDAIRYAISSFASTIGGARTVREISKPTDYSTLIQVKFEGESGTRYFEVIIKERY